MIAYIKGRMAYKDFDNSLVIVENGGIGYRILVSGRDLDLLPGEGEEVKLHTYLHVKEDAMQLIGFLTRDDLKVFKLLLGVSGIGPKGALGVLTALSADALRFAVLSDDAKTISKAPGIGHKTAQKLILELKDKLKLEDAFEEKLSRVQQEAAAVQLTDARNEAVQALTALGYSGSDALKAVRQVNLTEDMDTEDILRAALKQMSFL